MIEIASHASGSQLLTLMFTGKRSFSNPFQVHCLRTDPTRSGASQAH